VAVQQVKVRELVERALNQRRGVPEFQCGFVWEATQGFSRSRFGRTIRSAFCCLGITDARQEERVEKDGVAAGPLIVDEQRRTLALAILINRKP